MTAQTSWPTIDDPLVGQLLFGEYSIMGIAGDGSSTRVYLAKQVTADRIVAIKTLKVLKPQIVSQFSDHMKDHENLIHTNIVKTIACHQSDIGRPFFVMEFIEGISLCELIAAGCLDREEEEEVAQIVIQTCHALEYAHAAGVVHGDIKTSNIMLDETDGSLVVKMLDFGFGMVKPAVEALTGGGVLSYGYAAPECLSKQGPDARSDVYSLGVITYLLLAGDLPIASSDSRLFSRKGGALPNPVPLAELRPEVMVGSKIESILTKALSIDRNDRQQTVTEFRMQIEDWIEQVRLHRTDPAGTTDSAGETNTQQLISFLKESNHNIVTLRQAQRRTEETLIMKVSDTLAAKGPRQSPRQIAIKSVITAMLIAGFALLAYSAYTQYPEQIRNGWSAASISVSRGFSSQDGTKHIEKQLPAAPSAKSPLITSSSQNYTQPQSAILSQNNPGALDPKAEWPVNKLLIEVPYHKSQPSYGITNNVR